MAEKKAVTLFHGSKEIVEKPVFGIGNPHNDYGLGFYCTEDVDLAREWACPTEVDGIVNEYELALAGLKVTRISDSPEGVLEWLAVLAKNRRFEATTPLAAQAKAFLAESYPREIDDVDVIIGYRADDSYFSFARAFLDNRISLRQLDRAMRLGNLGHQVVLRSRKAFDAIEFVRSEDVSAQEWYPKRWARDQRARREYHDEVINGEVRADDVFVLDLMRESGWLDGRH